MAEQIKGSKQSTSINPSPSGPYGRGACYPEIGKETQTDVSKYRPGWATSGTAAKDHNEHPKAPAQSAVGAQFPARRK
jgi:hypothetical protein